MDNKSYLFNKGDGIICVRSSTCIGLTLYKRYKVVEVNDVCVTVINDDNYRVDYNFFRFVTLPEFRKMKLNKLGIC